MHNNDTRYINPISLQIIFISNILWSLIHIIIGQKSLTLPQWSLTPDA